MLIRRGFKFELKPNGMQIQLMKQFCGCARYVYNRTLSLEKSLYKKDSKHSFKYTEAANRLPEWKKKNPHAKGNIRDNSTISQLIVLANLENLNATFIKDGLSQSERLLKLNQEAIYQLTTFENNTNIKKIEKLNK